MKTQRYRVSAIFETKGQVELVDEDGKVYYAKVPADQKINFQVGEYIELLTIGGKVQFNA